MSRGSVLICCHGRMMTAHGFSALPTAPFLDYEDLHFRRRLYRKIGVADHFFFRCPTVLRNRDSRFPPPERERSRRTHLQAAPNDTQNGLVLLCVRAATGSSCGLLLANGAADN